MRLLKVVNAAVIPGVWFAFIIIPNAAPSSALNPRLLRSSISSFQPPPVPIPRTGGGGMTSSNPALSGASACRISLAIASAVPRSACGLSVMNIAPPLEAVEKVAPSSPANATVSCTAGFLCAMSAARRISSVVRWSDAPGGNCAATIR